MGLTIDELELGIMYWKGKNKWPQDYHNAFYSKLINIHPNGVFNQEWWDSFLPLLRSWRATRPYGRAVLTPRAQARFDALGEAWAKSVAPFLNKDIEEIEWVKISPFTIVVSEIKNVESPVFTSKFCHFLAPRIFPVIDKAAMGKPFKTYKEYFENAQQEWAETDQKTRDNLEVIFKGSINTPLASKFPMKCKLIEICVIGRNKRVKLTV